MLTVAEVLDMPVVKQGLPEIVAGQEHLDGPVRWAHVLDVAEVAGLLKGREFVLNNGFGIGSDATVQRDFIRDLAHQEVAALAVELGICFRRSLPAPMVREAERVGLPLTRPACRGTCSCRRSRPSPWRVAVEGVVAVDDVVRVDVCRHRALVRDEARVDLAAIDIDLLEQLAAVPRRPDRVGHRDVPGWLAAGVDGGLLPLTSRCHRGMPFPR
jgi:hypothetical protein